MRKVMVRVGDPKNKAEEIEKEAYFHQWGLCQVINEEGSDFAVTAAIVESVETGEVIMVGPDKVRFIYMPES